jgi:hypothetical protein
MTSSGTSGRGPIRGRLGARIRQRLLVVFAAAVAILLPALVAPTQAYAAVTAAFELDGNVLDDAAPPPDWGASSGTNSIFTVSAGQGVPRTPLPANFLSAGFSRDFTPGASSDTSTFTTGSKDTLNIGTGWACVGANNVTDKGDIQNGYAAAYFDPVTQHLILYFGMEKNAPNGNNNMGVWFLRDGSVSCNNPSSGGGGLAFTGNHQDGDILLVAAFTGGGSSPTANAYRWNGGAGGSLGTTALGSGGLCGSAGSADLCAITNDTASVTTPWQTQDKASANPQNKTGLGTTLSPDQFYEGAIDLTAFGLDKDAQGQTICINRFVFNTRSSQELGASLFDFAAGNVETCAAPTIATNLFRKNAVPPDTSLAPPNNTVTLPVQVYDTATLTGALGTPTGTVTYSLWTNNTCTAAATSPTFPGGGNTATVTIAADGTIPHSPTLTFDTAGSFWWQAVYNGGGRNAASDPSPCTSEPLVVQKVQPAIATTPNPTALTIGTGASFNDTATISNGFFPTGGIAPGDVTFTLYGPFASAAAITCTSAIFTSTVAAARVDDTTANATSASFTPTQVGIYQWVAAYAGNAQNQPASTLCNDTAEQVTVAPTTPPIATKILLSDQAKVSSVPGAGNPTGSVLFQLYPSADCTGTVVHSETQALAGDGTAATATATAVNAGTYSWKVTFTSTNPNYTGAATTCTAAQSDEKAEISYAGTSPIS